MACYEEEDPEPDWPVGLRDVDLQLESLVIFDISMAAMWRRDLDHYTSRLRRGYACEGLVDNLGDAILSGQHIPDRWRRLTAEEADESVEYLVATLNHAHGLNVRCLADGCRDCDLGSGYYLQYIWSSRTALEAYGASRPSLARFDAAAAEYEGLVRVHWARIKADPQYQEYILSDREQTLANLLPEFRASLPWWLTE